jgi:uncharacterized membrane protein YsdA (DUF1294 family)
MSVLVVIALLVLPGIALHRGGVDYRWAAAFALAISALTYWIYAVDKRRAENGEWRVPEARLHLLDLLGGWPGGFLAQRRLRHKCSKGSYQFVFWLIVLAWQFTAADSLQNWKYSKIVLNVVDRAAEHRR